MTTIGITGGIGSGKSIVSAILDIAGIPVYIADTESKRLTLTSETIRIKLIELFGQEIYSSKGLNKKLLAEKIFNNPEALTKVNSIIHPEVFKDFLKWVSKQNCQFCAIESAILFESGFDKLTDLTLMVYAPQEVRVKRAIERDQSSRDAIIKRMENQLSDEVKKEKADYVICNDGCAALIPQVTSFIEMIRDRTEAANYPKDM